MTMPRWLVVSLLTASALVALGAVAWLWIEMPKRTAAKFISAIESGDIERANHFLDGTCSFEQAGRSYGSVFRT